MRVRTDLLVAVVRMPCPKCGEPAGVGCTTRRLGLRRWPHFARVEVWGERVRR